MIDTHLHLGRLLLDDPGLTPARLLRWMDRQGIERGVVMAVETPEELDFYLPTRELLRRVRPHRDRLSALCMVDPRHRYPGKFDPYPLIQHYVDQGCVGVGENLCGLPVDDPMQQRLYAACDRLHLPIVMHFDDWINRDRPGLPGFERMLEKYPNCRFVGHAQYFWREISRSVAPEERYPTGPVVPGGRIEQLLDRYPNLYCDLSAGSGYGALARDPAFGRDFLTRWQKRLLFATDTIHTRPGEFCTVATDAPLIHLLREAGLTKTAYNRITCSNARKVFPL